MQKIDFSKPVRQSPKGVMVIFGFRAFKFFKSFFIIFVAFGLSLIRKNSIVNLSPPIIILILFVIFISILIFSILKYLNFKFHVTHDDFLLSSGIFNKDNIVIPKSKIQNVNITQNFLQQLINVVSVKIETAGDDSSEIEINALDRENARRLKEELFVKKPTLRQENEDEIEIKDDVFFKASIKRLLLEGISQNHFKSFLIILSTIFGLYYEVKDYVKDLKLEENLQNNINVADTNLTGLLFLYIASILVFLLISITFSVVKTLIVNFNLEVIEHHKNIEINKGLFNKMSLTLTPSRIQNLVVKSNRLKEYLGLYRLSVKQAMVNKKQQKNFGIVALDKQQLNYLVRKLFNNYSQPSTYQKPESYFKRVLWFQLGVVLLVLNLPLFFVFGNLFWIANIPLVLLIAVYVHFKYEKSRYAISDGHITIGSGFIDTLVNILEIHKIQSVQFKQSFFQKRRDIASVVISTASKNVSIPYVKSEIAKSICDRLLFEVESQHRDWM